MKRIDERCVDFRTVTTYDVDGPLPFRVDAYGLGPTPHGAVARACARTGLAAGPVSTVTGGAYVHRPYVRKAKFRPQAAPPQALPEAAAEVSRLPAKELRTVEAGSVEARRRAKLEAMRAWVP